ncbi:fibronectin type III domain-containing protein [Marinirhabdus gelatinilytica]|uniref:Putative secreted protein (Por secretion system target) n=1 Tax=Marinirhabdus gelatinilytica TaxID=1703343 RepID=A0A370Q537_9FLAO|nr:fibronectin type III domain-containing protein [Marinirhabdus gelatinilytica]RDK83468.1 putative secreted protein (Por secretion system target) [Marinirhabdus gelatinilytica]
MKKLVLVLATFFMMGQAVFAQCEVSENFDTYNNGEVPVDWTMIDNTNGTNSYGQVTSDPASPTPPKYFRMYSGNATTGDLLFISPINPTTSDGNHRVKFYLEGFGDSNLVLGTIDTNDGTGTFSPITTLATTTDWVFHEVVIPAGTDQYLAFKHDALTTFDQVNLDSICLEEIPTCLEVTNVMLSSPTETTLDIAWDESASNEDNWEYVVQEIGTGIPVANGTAYSSPNASVSFTVTGLTMNTEYEAYVRADCGGGDYGAWILSGNTERTDCGIITSNFCEDWAGVEDDTVPFCWSVYDDPMTSGHALVDYQFAYSKNMFELTFTSTTVLGDIVAISPDVTYATDGTHRLRFTAGASDTTPDVLKVGTIDAMGNFVEITSLTLNPDRETEYLVDLPNNGHSHFAFQHGGAVNKTVWINTVCVEDIPSCLEVTNVAATNVQYNSADISWNTSGSSETAWEYIVQEATMPAPDATTSGTEVNTTMVTAPLGPNTAYIAYVRAKCDTNDFGAWIASEEFTSACDIFVAEYNNGFEGLNVSGEEVKPCWNIIDTTTGDFRTYNTAYGIFPYEGSLMLRFYFTTSSDLEGLFLVSPEFSDLANDKQIRFRMNKRASNEADFTMQVGTMADPTDPTSFVLLDDTTLNETTIVGDTWNEYTIDLSTYDTTLGHSYIAFKPQHSGTGPSQYIFMDDFNYEYNPVQGFNDEPTTANILLASDDYGCNNAITGDFTGATQSPEFPCTAPTYSDYNDIWYRFTPDETGEYAFGAEDVTGDPLSMFIFEGPSTNPQPLSVGCSTQYSAQMLTAGVTYFVAVASPVPTSEFSLCVYKFPEVPVNDEPAGALVLTESNNNICENAVTGYTASGTLSDDSECGVNTIDVWYTFVPNSTANYTFRRTLINGAASTSVAVYSGTPGNLTQVTEQCNSYLQTVDLIAGETYYVSVSSGGSSIPIYFELCAYPSPPAPSNNECDAGIILTVGEDFPSSYIIGNNTSATRNENDPMVSCEGLEFEEKGKDVWYTVTVPDSGRLVLETQSDNDPYLDDTGMEAYIGECGMLESLACDSDGGQGFFSYIELTDLQPGATISVRVWGYVGRFGTFRLAAYDDSPTCEFPTDITITDITETSALLSWAEPTTPPSGGYEYIVQLEDTGYPGATTGTVTTETNAILDNLTPNTAYEVYVKSICDTNASAWDGPYGFITDEVLGVSEHEEISLQFYPNPVQDVLNFSASQVIETLTVYSLTGQIVQTERVGATQGQINLSGLSTGMYLVEVQTSYGNELVKVFVE